MALVASTTETQVPIVYKDEFYDFLIRRGVRNFDVFTVDRKKYLFIAFDSGGEHMKYALRQLEIEFLKEKKDDILDVAYIDIEAAIDDYVDARG